ncbi:phage tail tube protein [Falsiroseomonas sp.]|uniref:phage tail tube protein n=1 Tax=Falsiroseomonas sp. TaxID=2870721 RepID=UPI002719CA35|nr:phage tail tube protein [Falsiroseomonas sp.]MDO9501389.1 phage tail tube protein [Falsiroseomonas sp.]
MAQTLGIVDFTWRGQSIPAKKGSKFKLGGTKSNPVVTGRRVDHAHEFEASEVSATFALRRGMSLLALFAPGEGPLEVLADTGQTYSFPDAFVTNRPEATSGEGGDVEIMWSAGEPNEVV